MTKEHEWLAYPEAATRYEVSTRTLQRMVHAGVVTTKRRPWRIPRVVLNATDIEAALGEIVA